LSRRRPRPLSAPQRRLHGDARVKPSFCKANVNFRGYEPRFERWKNGGRRGHFRSAIRADGRRIATQHLLCFAAPSVGCHVTWGLPSQRSHTRFPRGRQASPGAIDCATRLGRSEGGSAKGRALLGTAAQTGAGPESPQGLAPHLSPGARSESAAQEKRSLKVCHGGRQREGLLERCGPRPHEPQ